MKSRGILLLKFIIPTTQNLESAHKHQSAEQVSGATKMYTEQVSGVTKMYTEQVLIDN